MMITVYKNTRSGWTVAQKKAYENIEAGKSDVIDFYLTLDTSKYDRDESDITNLRYYFPLCDSLQKANYQCSLTINPSNSESRSRALAFLKYCGEIDSIRETISIYDLKKVKNDLKNIEEVTDVTVNDIFPIIVTPKDLLDLTVLKIFNAQIIKSLERMKIDDINAKQKIDELKINDNDNDIPTNILAKTIAAVLTKNIFGECEMDLKYVYKNIVESCILSARSYADGIYQVIENACRHSQGKIAFWGFRIHYADKNAVLSKYAKATQTRTRLYEKYKWCFTNHYPNGVTLADSTVSERVFGNDEYKYYLEVFVLDNAVEYLDNKFKTTGIVEKIRSSYKYSNNSNGDLTAGAEIKDSDNKIFCIEDIFYLDENDYIVPHDYYITHYGLRWFDKIIKKNDGIYYVITPQRSRMSGYYSHKSYDPKQQRTIGSVVSALKDLPVSVTFSNNVDEWLKNNRFNPYRFVSSYCYERDKYIEQLYSTEYNILLPISQLRNEHNEDNSASNLKIFDYYEKSILDWSDKKCNFNSCKLTEHDKKILASGTKTDKIELVCKLVMGLPTMHYNEIGYRYSIINIEDCFWRDKIEVVAKSLFLAIYKLRKESGDIHTDNEILFTLDFDDQDQLMFLEFVRVFSIVYDKLGNNSYMENVQIALCYNKDGEKKVGLVIAGKDLASAYKSARAYLYHNGADSVPFLSALDDLSYNSDANSSEHEECSVQKLYPFDIRLVDSATGKSLFLTRIGKLLERDYQEQAYGCKISNTHIRVSSRIHLTEFYEAELLFHSISNVYKFAEILADEIQKDWQKDVADGIYKDGGAVLLVGYEKYSSILILRLQDVLKKRAAFTDTTIYGAIVEKSGDDQYELGRSEVHWFGSNNVTDTYDEKTPPKSENINVYSVVPIGSTMSTVYKVHDIIKRDLVNRFALNNTDTHYGTLCFSSDDEKSGDNIKCPIVEFVRNYVIVAVIPLCRSDEIVQRYFECPPTDSVKEVFRQLTICPQKATENVSQKVKYLLEGNVKWYDADNCEICQRERLPLVHVDKTATLPKVIFEEIKDNKRASFYNRRELHEELISGLEPNLEVDNSGNLKCKSYLTYGHIANGDNHYQFYFNFDEVSQKMKKEIGAWAGKIEIDKRAFNIVVSPLSESNSVFLKIILDEVFESTARFLHIDIGMYKEDVRAKFSYISKEIKDIKLQNPSTRINFYFVDTSTSQGVLLQRSKMLMSLLLGQAQLSDEQQKNIALYKKIFLLINRSSYDTMKLFLECPEKDCLSYYNILFPAFNMKRGECPTCKLQRRYEILRKKSSTVDVAKEFDRLAYKHEKRDLADYNDWIANEILEKHSYFGWLKLWLISSKAYGINDENENLVDKTNKVESGQEVKIIGELRKKILEYVESKEFVGELYNLQKWDADNIQNYLKSVANTTLRKFCADMHLSEQNVIELVKYVISKRAVVRFDALQQSYNDLMVTIWGQLGLNSVNNQAVEKTEYAIWDLLCHKLSLEMKPEDVYDDFEWIESCVKAICREQIVNYYRVRMAVFSVLKQLLVILTDDKPRNSYSPQKKILWRHLHNYKPRGKTDAKERIVPVMCQYNLCSAIAQGLAFLHSYKSLGFSENNIENDQDVDDNEFIVNYEDVYNRTVKKFIRIIKSDSYNKFLYECPSRERMVISRIVAIKTATMLEEDDAKCFKLIKSLRRDTHESGSN